jgi:hypothetical protein
MALTIEDGSGVIGANSYMTEAEVSAYLTDRGRETDWDAATAAVTTAALIEATDYIEQRFGDRFKGRVQYIWNTVGKSVLTLTAQPTAADIVTIGSTVYAFQSTMASAFDVLIGDNITDSLDNLIAAVNLTGTAGTEYFAGTTEHPDAGATVFTGLSMLVQSDDAGEDQNAIVTTTDITGATWSFATLNGANDVGIPQPLSFPRLDLYDLAGQVVVGIPTKLKNAVAEYASRALAATLLADPTVDATGNAVKMVFEKVGPLETKTEYFGGGTQQLGVYPAADRFLKEYTYPRRIGVRG